MSDAVKREIARTVVAARRELNRRLSEAHIAGIKVEVDVREFQVMQDRHPRAQVEVHLYEKIE